RKPAAVLLFHLCQPGRLVGQLFAAASGRHSALDRGAQPRKAWTLDAGPDRSPAGPLRRSRGAGRRPFGLVEGRDRADLAVLWGDRVRGSGAAPGPEGHMGSGDERNMGATGEPFAKHRMVSAPQRSA